MENTATHGQLLAPGPSVPRGTKKWQPHPFTLSSNRGRAVCLQDPGRATSVITASNKRSQTQIPDAAYGSREVSSTPPASRPGAAHCSILRAVGQVPANTALRPNLMLAKHNHKQWLINWSPNAISHYKKPGPTKGRLMGKTRQEMCRVSLGHFIVPEASKLSKITRVMSEHPDASTSLLGHGSPQKRLP